MLLVSLILQPVIYIYICIYIYVLGYFTFAKMFFSSHFAHALIPIHMKNPQFEIWSNRTTFRGRTKWLLFYVFSYVLLLYEIEYIKVMWFSGRTCILYFEYKIDKPKMTENVSKLYEVTNTDDFNNVKRH